MTLADDDIAAARRAVSTVKRLAGEPITITALRAFPVIRDLVTDVSFNYEKAAQIPAFAPQARDADGHHRMQQVDVERSQEFRKCIGCFLSRVARTVRSVEWFQAAEIRGHVADGQINAYR